MRQEIKDRWIAALTDGSYKQGFSVLQDSKNRFCCLGVLCDLYFKETGIGRWGKDDKDKKSSAFFIDDKKYGTMLPIPVREWAGLERSNPMITPVKSLPAGREIGINTFETLTQINDGGYSFAKIAEIIKTDL